MAWTWLTMKMTLRHILGWDTARALGGQLSSVVDSRRVCYTCGAFARTHTRTHNSPPVTRTYLPVATPPHPVTACGTTAGYFTGGVGGPASPCCSAACATICSGSLLHYRTCTTRLPPPRYGTTGHNTPVLAPLPPAARRVDRIPTCSAFPMHSTAFHTTGSPVRAVFHLCGYATFRMYRRYDACHHALYRLTGVSPCTCTARLACLPYYYLPHAHAVPAPAATPPFASTYYRLCLHCGTRGYCHPPHTYTTTACSNTCRDTPHCALRPPHFRCLVLPPYSGCTPHIAPHLAPHTHHLLPAVSPDVCPAW